MKVNLNVRMNQSTGSILNNDNPKRFSSLNIGNDNPNGFSNQNTGNDNSFVGGT